RARTARGRGRRRARLFARSRAHPSAQLVARWYHSVPGPPQQAPRRSGEIPLARELLREPLMVRSSVLVVSTLLLDCSSSSSDGGAGGAGGAASSSGAGASTSSAGG